MLLEKIAAERILLRSQAKQLRSTLDMTDTGIELFTKIKRSPLISVSSIFALALMLFTQRKRLSTFFKKGMSAWAIWRSVAPIIKSLLGRKSKTQPAK